jgi:hypothetical protein
MAVYFNQKFGFLTVAELLWSIDQELTTTKGNGKKYFTRKYAGIGGNRTQPWNNASDKTSSLAQADMIDNTPKVLIYEATTDSDPMANYQLPGSLANSTWRICFIEWVHPSQVNSQSQTAGVSVTIGTNIQLPNDGEIALLNDRTFPPANASINAQSPFAKSVMPPGTLSATWRSYNAPNDTTTQYGQPNTVDEAKFDDLWLNRMPTNTYGNQLTGDNNRRAYPMSYMISMTSRGLYIGIWEDSQEEIPQIAFNTALNDASDEPDGYGKSPFRWFVVQRGVDRVTGHVRGGEVFRDDVDPAAETSRCPVFVVGGTTRAKQFFKFVAREMDVVSPSRPKLAMVDSEDSPSCLNPWPQNSISESGEFVVNFINNLSTPRFRYADELDMVGTVGAEVIGAGTIIEVNVYNEQYPRKYIAAYATNKFGTGMRLMVLMDASEIDEENHIYKVPTETYSLTSNVTTGSGNTSILFTFNTTNVSNGKTYYYHITNNASVTTSNISRYDFTDLAKSGTFTIQSNTANVVKTLSSTLSFNTPTQFKMVVRRLSNEQGNIVASTANITITP